MAKIKTFLLVRILFRTVYPLFKNSLFNEMMYNPENKTPVVVNNRENRRKLMEMLFINILVGLAGELTTTLLVSSVRKL